MENGKSSYCRFLEGDDEGIVDIIRDYKDGLILYLNSIVKNLTLAEDLTEDTFVKIAVNKPKFREKFSFKAWLYAIGRNTAIDYFRKNKAQMDDIDNYSIADEENLEQDYIKNEQKLILIEKLKELPPDYYQVLYLTYFEDLSNQELTVVMKKTKRQIENLLYNAKKALRRKLEKGGFQYEEL